MTIKISDLLDKSRFLEPAEVQVIKNYLMEKFNTSGQVTVQSSQIIITVSGAALAGALRMHLHELQQRCATNKRLVIRIS